MCLDELFEYARIEGSMSHLTGIQGECGLIDQVPRLFGHVIYPRHVLVELMKKFIDQGHVVRLTTLCTLLP